jgi:hypothetical protein
MTSLGGILEGGKENEGINNWRFCSSEDEESFSKKCWTILHPILFKGKQDKTETPTMKKFIDFYFETWNHELQRSSLVLQLEESIWMKIK